MNIKALVATLLVVASPASASVINAQHKPNDNGWGSQENCTLPNSLRIVRAISFSAVCSDEFGG